MEISTELLQNGDDPKHEDVFHKTIVNASNGTPHNLVYNVSTRKLIVSLVEYVGFYLNFDSFVVQK